MHSTTLPFAVPLPDDMPFAFSLHALALHLQSVRDQRKPRGRRYPLPVLLSLAVLAKLAGQTRLEPLAHWAHLRAAALAALFGLERPHMPHQSTWSRVLGTALDPNDLEHALRTFFHTPSPESERASMVLAVDGKTLRGTIPLGQTQGVHLVVAYLPDEGIVLTQLAVDKKQNEIVVVPTLLAQLDLHGMIVTGDAMQAQRGLSAQVVEHGGHYMWFVKENQPSLLAEITDTFTPPITLGHAAPRHDVDWEETWDKGHGRLETRTMTVSRMLAGYSDWPYLEQVFKLERIVWQDRKARSHKVRYGVTSLPGSVATAKELLRFARGEWGIENGLHYRRDVTIRLCTCPESLARIVDAACSVWYAPAIYIVWRSNDDDHTAQSSRADHCCFAHAGSLFCGVRFLTKRNAFRSLNIRSFELLE